MRGDIFLSITRSIRRYLTASIGKHSSETTDQQESGVWVVRPFLLITCDIGRPETSIYMHSNSNSYIDVLFITCLP